MAFMSLSFRQSHCHDLLMAKAKSLSVFERGRIVERAQRTIAAEVGRSKTVILHFLKDPESYRSKKSSGRPPKKIHLHCAGGSDGLSVKTVVNFFLVEAETRRRWDIFQAEVTLYWELAVRRCSHPSLNLKWLYKVIYRHFWRRDSWRWRQFSNKASQHNQMHRK